MQERRRMSERMSLSAEQPAEPEAWKTKGAPGRYPVRHLDLKENDELHRRKDAPKCSGYCVDELCGCEKSASLEGGHECRNPDECVKVEGYTSEGIPLGVEKEAYLSYLSSHGIKGSLPSHLYFHSVKDDRDFATENRTKYTPKEVGSSARGVVQYDKDGVPLGIDKDAWNEYCAKFGVPPRGQIPAQLYFKRMEDNRDFGTEYRHQYFPKEVSKRQDGNLYGPDGVPLGVDPKAWREEIAKNGMPPRGVVPAHLYYQRSKESRTFETENRNEFTPKLIGERDSATLVDSEGIPIGVDKQKWLDYIKINGRPPKGVVPAHLYYVQTQEQRDFSTEQRVAYTPKLTKRSGEESQLKFGSDGIPHGIVKAAWAHYLQSKGLCPPGFVPSSLLAKKEGDCQLKEMPPAGLPVKPLEHTFWDPIAKRWY